MIGLLVLLIFAILILLIKNQISLKEVKENLNIQSREIDILKYQIYHKEVSEKLDEINTKSSTEKVTVDEIAKSTEPDYNNETTIDDKTEINTNNSSSQSKSKTTRKTKDKSSFDFTKWFPKDEWESIIGTKLLNRIGALALIIGIGFFLKYAFDKNWISEWVRVSIGFVSGFILIFGGWHFNKKEFKVLSQGLFGSGIATLFLSVFALFNFYHLVPQIVAFVLMAIITAFTFYISIRFNSIAVAVLGWFGGFLTPFLLSTGQANEIGLFSYIVLLDLGILLIFALKSEWTILLPLVLAGTYFTFFAWADTYYINKDALITSLFLSVFWILFLLVDFYKIMTGKIKSTTIYKYTNFFSYVLFYCSFYFVFNKGYHDWLGLVTLIIAGKYFGLLWLNNKKYPDDTEDRNLLLIPAIVFVILATIIQFKSYITISFVAMEALALVYIGSKRNIKLLLNIALFVFVFIVMKQFISDDEIHINYNNFIVLFNTRILGLVFISHSAFLSSYFLGSIDIENKNITSIKFYEYISALAIIYLAGSEIVNYHTLLLHLSKGYNSASIEFTETLSIGMFLVLYSISAIFLGFKYKRDSFLHLGIGTGVFGILTGLIGGFSYQPIAQFNAIFNYRALTLFIQILTLSGILLLIRRNLTAKKWMNTAYNTGFITFILMIVVLISLETADHFNYIIEYYRSVTYSPIKPMGYLVQQIDKYLNMKQLSLSGIWILYSIIMLSFGIWKRMKLLRLLSIGLFGITILKVFIYDLSFLDTFYRIISFIALGIILLAVSYLYQKYKDIILN